MEFGRNKDFLIGIYLGKAITKRFSGLDLVENFRGKNFGYRGRKVETVLGLYEMIATGSNPFTKKFGCHVYAEFFATPTLLRINPGVKKLLKDFKLLKDQRQNRNRLIGFILLISKMSSRQPVINFGLIW